MSARDLAVTLEDMLASLTAIQQYMAGIDGASFQANPMLQDAVIRRLEILGEAANLSCQLSIARSILKCRGKRLPVCATS